METITIKLLLTAMGGGGIVFAIGIFLLKFLLNRFIQTIDKSFEKLEKKLELHQESQYKINGTIGIMKEKIKHLETRADERRQDTSALYNELKDLRRNGK